MKNNFIKRANIIHNYQYDYSNISYTNNRTKIKIICKIHAEFEQRTDSHLNGSGCQQCGAIKKAGYNLITIWELDWNKLPDKFVEQK